MANNTTDQEPIGKKATQAFYTLLGVIALGGIGVIFFCLNPYGCGRWACRWYADLSIGLLLAVASLSFGGFFGFLFGMPKTGDQSSPTGTKPNTNLEEISDWLTKILVGAGLTQLSKIPAKLAGLSAFIAGGMSDHESAKVFAGVSMVFFGVCGFLAVFLWTRLYMAGLLGSDTVDALRQKDAEQQKKIDETVSSFNKFLTGKIDEVMANPLASEQDRLDKAKPELEAATRFVQSQDEKEFTPTDYMVLAYDAYRKDDYQTAAENAEKSLTLKPAKEMLWKTYNFLGLCYHYQQPKDWKPGGSTDWLDKAITNYQTAIANKNSLEEEMLTKANLAFVYLDAGRYDDCMQTVAAVVANDGQEGERVASICDLARIADAAAKAMKNDAAGAANVLNSIKNIAEYGYLFNPTDLPPLALRTFANLTGLNPEVKFFVDKVAGALKL